MVYFSYPRHIFDQNEQYANTKYGDIDADLNEYSAIYYIGTTTAFATHT